MRTKLISALLIASLMIPSMPVFAAEVQDDLTEQVEVVVEQTEEMGEIPTVEPIVEETPTVEPIVEETPTEEPIVEETPSVEPIVEETPTEEPIVEETPTIEPVVEETPTEEPIAEETPTVEPVVEETPAIETEEAVTVVDEEVVAMAMEEPTATPTAEPTATPTAIPTPTAIAEEDEFILYSDPNGVLDIADEDVIVGQDEVLGVAATSPNKFYFTGESVNGYAILNSWSYFYLYNNTGKTMYNSNVYLSGEYQFRDRADSNGKKITCRNNSSKQVVLYYKYDANTCKLLTTWSSLEDWKYLDVFPVMTSWQYNSIKYCVDGGLMKGTGDHYFAPDVPITRAMFATVIYRMAGEPSVKYSAVFKDVPANKWYSDGIVWASKNGIVKGYSNGYYGPDDVITREQVTAILHRYATWRGFNTSPRVNLNNYSDQGAVSKWATENVKWAVAEGFMKGMNINGKNCLAPKSEATRAECAAMLMRFQENDW